MASASIESPAPKLGFAPGLCAKAGDRPPGVPEGSLGWPPCPSLTEGRD